MKIIRTHLFKDDFQKLPDNIKRSAEKALRMLLNDPRHPSLHIKKTKGEVIKGYQNVFEGRIIRNYRFLFLIESDAYVLLRCGSHDEFFK
jgi:mRNA-degrading endonuclease RelE of RelBE toxin-antitoxin system